MLYDGLTLLEGTSIENATVESGTSFPSTPSEGQLFYRTDSFKLFIFSDGTWSEIGEGAELSLDGLNVKPAVRVATTANITLSGTQTIDGVSVVAGNRVLVKNQSTGSQNGIYVVASGAWTRSTDFDGNPSEEVKAGDFVFVTEGTENADTGWILTTNGTIVVGTTSLAFAQFTGGTSEASSLSGTTLASNVVNSSLTSVGTLSSITTTGTLNLSGASARLAIGGSSGSNNTILVSGGSGAAPAWSSNLTFSSGVLQVGNNGATGQNMFRAWSTTTEMQFGQSTGTIAGFSAANIGVVSQGSAGTVPLGVGTVPNQPLILYTNNVERFRILGNGSWSVGTNGTSTGTAGQVLTTNGSGSAPTWQNPQGAAQTKLERVTTFNADALGKRVAISAGVTIPASTYATGDAVSFYNTTSSPITITQGSSMTLRLDGTTMTGNRTLAPHGTCFVWFNSSSEAIISGSVS